MNDSIRRLALIAFLILFVPGCCLRASLIANNVSGSFVVTTCESNSTLLVEGVAGTNLRGETVEVFDSTGHKVAEAGTVDSNGKFSSTVGPPNPFKVGDTVIIRIGPDVGRSVASQPGTSDEESG